MVFPGPVLLPASQALHPGRHGGSGKPRVQQQEDRTYPHSPPAVQSRPAVYHLLHNLIQDPLMNCLL